MIIAIDGPSGAGKTTLSRMIARALNLLYVDTGAMYRAVALAVSQSGIDMKDAEAVANIARRARINLAGNPDSLAVELDGRDVSKEIRAEEVSHIASVVSAVPEVRRTLVSRQRELGKQGRGVVLNGRDIGTVVFPDADMKFFLTGSPEARAERRYQEDLLLGCNVTFEETLADINERDRRDSEREDSPLAIAEDAVVIDTSDLSIEEVFERMIRAIHEQQAKDLETTS